MTRGDGVGIDIDKDQLFFDVMQTTQVKAAVRARAQQVAQRAIRMDKKEGTGGKATIRLVDRTLANGRVVTEVHSDDVDGEYGTSNRDRRAILRRAAGGRGR